MGGKSGAMFLLTIVHYMEITFTAHRFATALACCYDIERINDVLLYLKHRRKKSNVAVLGAWTFIRHFIA